MTASIARYVQCTKIMGAGSKICAKSIVNSSAAKASEAVAACLIAGANSLRLEPVKPLENQPSISSAV